MKRIFVFLFAFLIVANMAFTEESILIDFNDLVDDFQGNHQASLVDYSVVAGTRFTEEEKGQMNTSLYIPNWSVEFSSSSQTVINNSLSYVRAVTVNDNATQYASQQVMGVRIHFPDSPFNSYAWIEPPFTIPAYATSTFVDNPAKGDQFRGLGMVKNVGVLKSVKVNVYGMNHPLGLGVVMRTDEDERVDIPLGYLDFDGWRELSWNNPNYIKDVRNRTLVRYPLYPRNAPVLILDSIQIFKDAMQEGGDFIGYIKNITITYDQSIIQSVDSDLEHEQIWGILSDREEERRNLETSRLSNREVLRFLEDKKMHKEPEETLEVIQ